MDGIILSDRVCNLTTRLPLARRRAEDPRTDVTAYFASLARQADRHGDDVYYSFVDEDGTTTSNYAEFYARVQSTAAMLAARGIGRRDIVLVFAHHGAPMLHAFFGAQLLGAIPAFMPPPTSRQDPAAWRASHAALCERIRPALILADSDSIDALAVIAPDITRPLDDVVAAPLVPATIYKTHDQPGSAVAFLQHSSGTTGLKKGVMVTYDQLEAQVEAYASKLGLDGRNAVVSWLPIYHDMGLIAGTLLPFMLGLPVRWIHTFAWLARPQLFITALAQTPGAVAWLPNFAFPYLARRCTEALAPNALAGVKAVINCSEPCKPKDVQAFLTRFAAAGLLPGSVQVCYALAENVFAVTQSQVGQSVRTLSVANEELITAKHARAVDPAGPEASATFLSCGTTIAGTQLRIVGASREGDIGEIEVAGVSLCSGYYRNAELTAERFVDGWYRTGDRGFMDGAELFVTGRHDDLIIVRGRNLYAHDIEATVSEAGVTRSGRCVALGVPDDRTGTQTLVILAETSATSTEGSVPAIMEAVFAEFGVSPAEVLLVDPDVLVKTTSGKMSRADNLRRYMAGKLQSWGGER